MTTSVLCRQRRSSVVALALIASATCGICAIAGSMPVLIAARLAQGVGAALLLPSALVLATAAGPDVASRHRLVG